MPLTETEREAKRVPWANGVLRGPTWPATFIATHLINGTPAQVQFEGSGLYRDSKYRKVPLAGNGYSYKPIPLPNGIALEHAHKKFAVISTEAAGAAIRAACWPDWEGTVGYAESARGDSATVLAVTPIGKVVRVAVKQSDHCDYYDVVIPRDWVLALAEE